MDWKAFVASIVSSIAWPIVIIVLLIALRRHLPDIAERIEEITLPGGAKAKFVKALDKARVETEIATDETRYYGVKSELDERFLDLANKFPEAAILEAYKEVEAAILKLKKFLNLPQRTSLRNIVKMIAATGLVSPHALRLFISFQQARNAAVHTGNSNRITPGEAMEFMAHAEFLLVVFRGLLESWPTDEAGRSMTLDDIGRHMT